MTEIIGVRFKTGGKVYYFNPNGVRVMVGEHVIIETSKGIEFGECAQTNTMVDETELVTALRPMLRIATRDDFAAIERNARLEKEAYTVCQQKIIEHGLDMKLVEVKYSFDGSKVLFFFTSDGRVDFRGLVKDLAAIFHTRIELRQIGVRDEAKMMGGLGVCGRPYCCAQFLADFQPVSIKMAKTQNISLNPTKISGACGRLMCCLKYEQDTYEELLKTTPKLDSLVKTPDGIGTINAVQFLTEQVRVTLDNDPGSQHTYRNSEIEVIRKGKGPRPVGYELNEEGEQPQRPQRPAPRADQQPQPKPAQPQQPGKPAFNAGGKAAVSNVTKSVQPKPAQPKPAQTENQQENGEQTARRPQQPRRPRPAPQQDNGEQRPKRPQQPRRENPQEGGENAVDRAEGQQGGARRHRPRHHHNRGGNGGNGGNPA